MLAIAFLVIVGIVGVIAYIDVDLWVKPAKPKKKNPPPVQSVRRSRRQKSGFAMVIDMFEGFDRTLNDMAKGNPPYRCPPSRKKRW